MNTATGGGFMPGLIALLLAMVPILGVALEVVMSAISPG